MMINDPLPRLDANEDIRKDLLPYCRLKHGEIWEDPSGRHKVGCLDAAAASDVANLVPRGLASLAVQDPPYNLVAFDERNTGSFIRWCEAWVANTDYALGDNSAFYVWLGADQENDFQPLPDFMLMMRGQRHFKSRSFITMRNQRGYGTQNNWMCIRQELLYYTKGRPEFAVQYTEIPKVLKGYYKTVKGNITENIERSKSDCIRPGNVWIDIQQIFYRLQENVSGCYAQKPLKAIERLLLASSRADDIVVDFFAHAGTTLLAAEILNRKCYTMDIDPVYCEITIRRLEHFRATGETGWQNGNPFRDNQNNSHAEGSERAAFVQTSFL